MKKKTKKLILFSVLFLLFWLQSCQKWGEWDAPAGNQKIVVEEEPVDPAYSNVSEPTIGKDGDNYYIISSNAIIDGITEQKGLMIRATTNLVNMGMTDSTAYILSGIVDSKKEELLAFDSSVDTSEVSIREPYLLDIGDSYLLYYSVSSGGSPSLIGVASASGLSGFQWEDEGTILTSGPSTGYVAACPSVIEYSGSYYLIFGNAGIYAVKLSSDGKEVDGAPVNIINSSTASSPSMVYYDGHCHLFFTVYGQSVHEGAGTSPTGDFTDYTGYPSADLNFRVLTPYVIDGGTTFSATTGVNVWQDPDNSKWFVVHEASGSLHIRSLSWIDPDYVTDDFANGCNFAIPSINPQRFTQAEGTAITPDDMVGAWNYGTLWEISESGSNAISSTAMDFSDDGTYTDGGDGGEWSMDYTTNILTLHSNSWGEYLTLYVFYASDWDNDMAPVLTASGTDMYSWYGGSWMQHSRTGEEELFSRTGIFAPTVGYDGNLYYLVAGNAALSGYKESWDKWLLWAHGPENSNVGKTHVASGPNSVFSLHPGVWTKQQR